MRGKLIFSESHKQDLLHVTNLLYGGSGEQLRISSTAFERGLANHGCFFHQAESSDGAIKVVFVEKRTIKAREIVFASGYSEFYASAPVPIAPKIFFVKKRETYTSIFMEYVRGVAEPFARSLDNAALLGAAMANIHLPNAPPLKASLFESHHRTVSLFLECIKADGLATVDSLAKAKAIVELVAKLERRARKLPWVLSHNDVNVGNTAYSILGGASVFRFVDWGQFSANIAGAEMHHFIAASIIKTSLKPFVMKALEEYAAGLRRWELPVSYQDVLFGAHYYALLRSISRYVQRRGKADFERIFIIYAHLQEKVP